MLFQHCNVHYSGSKMWCNIEVRPKCCLKLWQQSQWESLCWYIGVRVDRTRQGLGWSRSVLWVGSKQYSWYSWSSWLWSTYLCPLGFMQQNHWQIPVDHSGQQRFFLGKWTNVFSYLEETTVTAPFRVECMFWWCSCISKGITTSGVMFYTELLITAT